MSITDIFPDIHGQAGKLRGALATLGWRRTGTSWSHSEPDRQIVFLGDFIDRGPENGAVIQIVRQLIDSGRAQAIMGNHELNALHFHTRDPEGGLPLRTHEKKNIDQHESFLKEFPFGAPETKEAIDWMKGLPLFIETEGYRAIHAAWIQSAIDDLLLHAPTAVLSSEQLIRAARKEDVIYGLAETLVKGPEFRLPEGCSFTDKDDHVRHHVRLKWWKGDAKTWREIAMSVPNVDQLPDGPLPATVMTSTYPHDERPVFFGHYWLSGPAKLQAPNALCLDYSAGADGPLVTYSLPEGGREIRITGVYAHQ